jgi:hypothetical protein
MRRFNFHKQTKIILSSSAIIGGTIGLGCAYVYAIIESVVVSK